MKKFSIVVVVCALSLAASADLELGGIGAMWGADGTGNTWENMMDPTNGGSGDVYTLSQMWNVPDNCTFDFDLTYDIDPYVLGAFAVTNNASFDQTFTFTFTGVVDPALLAPIQYAGSMSGSMTADNPAGSPDGTLSIADGSSFYTALVDGVPLFTLYDGATQWDAAAGDSIDILAADLPLTPGGPAVVSTIEIVYELTLTPGETFTGNGNFAVIGDPIPEPATMTLLGLGAILLRRRKR